jgi:hypothetical protein
MTILKLDRRSLIKGTTAAVAGVLAAPMIGRAQAKTIRIGMQTILSGRVAQLGTSSRNAVMLEVEKINASGGLAGRPIEAVHGFSDTILVGRNDLSQIFRVHASGECRRTNKVGKQHCDLAALGGVLRGPDDRRSGGGRRRFIGAQGGDGVEQLATMPNDADTQILQVLRRQVRQDGVVDLVLPECRLVAFEAKAA